MATLSSRLCTRLGMLECHDSTFLGSETQPTLILSRAKGSLVYDVEGREFIDLCAGFGSLALGHNHSSYHETIKSAWEADRDRAPRLVQGMGDVYPSESKIEFLSAFMKQMPPHLERASLALTGSQAVEIAIKTMLLHQKRSGMIALKNGYHGVDFGALTLTNRENFKQGLQSWLAPSPVIDLNIGAPRSEIETAIGNLKNSPYGFAGIIVEPIQGRGGMNKCPIEWLSQLRTICDEHEGLLIFDEIFTGFGRIGSISTAFEVESDISVFGKAVGGGYPVSVCVAKSHIMNSWPKSKGEAMHTGTFFGHPLSCQIATATIETIANEKLALRSSLLGNAALAILTDELQGHPYVDAIRGDGLFIAVLLKDPQLATQVVQSLQLRGVLAIPCGEGGRGVSITPALNIPEDLLFHAMGILVQAIKEL